LTRPPATFERFQLPLPGLSGADRLALFNALPESDRREMERNRVVRIADRRFLDGEVGFVSRKPKPKPKRRPTRGPAFRSDTSADNWRRETEVLAQVPAETYLPVFSPDCEPHRGRIRCPLPDHEDLHPSATYRDSVWFCHRCGEGGGIFRAASAITGLADRGDQFPELRRWVADRLLGVAA
jgi:hypothetical protein